jgi:hypothetical protein
MKMFKRLRLKSAKSRLVEERLYEMVADEIEAGSIRKGLWAKATAKSNGSESQTKSKYLELRVESLKDEFHVVQSILEPENHVVQSKPEPEKANSDLTEVKKSSNEKESSGGKGDPIYVGFFSILFSLAVSGFSVPLIMLEFDFDFPKDWYPYLLIASTIFLTRFTWKYWERLLK